MSRKKLVEILNNPIIGYFAIVVTIIASFQGFIAFSQDLNKDTREYCDKRIDKQDTNTAKAIDKMTAMLRTAISKIDEKVKCNTKLIVEIDKDVGIIKDRQDRKKR